MIQTGVTGDLPADAFSLIAQHCAHAFQFANNPVDFLHRIGGNALDQCIRIIAGWVNGWIDLAALQMQECDMFDLSSFLRCASVWRSEFLGAGFR